MELVLEHPDDEPAEHVADRNAEQPPDEGNHHPLGAEHAAQVAAPGTDAAEDPDLTGTVEHVARHRIDEPDHADGDDRQAHRHDHGDDQSILLGVGVAVDVAKARTDGIAVLAHRPMETIGGCIDHRLIRRDGPHPVVAGGPSLVVEHRLEWHEHALGVVDEVAVDADDFHVDRPPSGLDRHDIADRGVRQVGQRFAEDHHACPGVGLGDCEPAAFQEVIVVCAHRRQAPYVILPTQFNVAVDHLMSELDLGDRFHHRNGRRIEAPATVVPHDDVGTFEAL